MKQLMLASMVILMMLSIAGCSEKGPRVYVSKRGEYTINYPKAFRMIDDDRKLNEARVNANKELKGPVKFDFNPDVVFLKKGKKIQGGMVVRSPVPIFEPSKKITDKEEELLIEMFNLFATQTGSLPLETKK